MIVWKKPLLICQKNLFLKGNSEEFPLNCASFSDVIWKMKKFKTNLTLLSK